MTCWPISRQVRIMNVSGAIPSKVRRFGKATPRSIRKDPLSRSDMHSFVKRTAHAAALPSNPSRHGHHLFHRPLRRRPGRSGAGHDLAFEEIDRLEALLSNYRPSSELSRISREAGSIPVVTDPESFRFLERSLYWSRVSNGAFDITVGPLLRAWGFFFHQGRVPSQTELNAVRNKIGWKNIALDPQTRTVSFTNHQAMELDPGSIGKGFAVDSVAKLLRNRGVTSAFISAGGSTLYAIGTVPGTAGWPVDIPDPRQPGKAAATIQLKDTSLSTGACTEKFFIKNSHRYCHIFDPRTMRPVEGMLQTTVIDPQRYR